MVDIRMTLGKLILKKNKAVSPVIATILLIALTVTAAAIVYFVVVPLLTGNPELTSTSYGTVAATTDRFTIKLENIGQAEATFAAITDFIASNTTDDYEATAVYIGTTAVTFPYVLNAGESATFEFVISGDFTAGSSYTIKIIYDGDVFETPAFTA
ncbi:MAG: hypothetical protein EAX90_06650 [Candidatus Heimdallarchaeota archaeon]|nr:hypothetical protein [Candidatus Heimdallarchaeota archaeon]